MKRAWFADTNGTYYRNCPLIMAEMRRCTRVPWRYWLFWRLNAEWREVFRQGIKRKSRLSRGDVVVQPRPFREAYPQYPALWQLDDEKRTGDRS